MDKRCTTLDIDSVSNAVLMCVQKVRRYLLSGKTSDEVVGYNLYGDISKTFDVEAENMLVSCLNSTVGDIIIVGEERGIRAFGEKRWIALVDPIDGSTNYEADIPWSAISMAIGAYKGGRVRLRDVLLAVLAEIPRDRIYIYRNGVVSAFGTSVRRRSTPKKIVLGYFNSYETFNALELYSKTYGGSKLRVLGSAALDILSVALGNAEVFIDVTNRLRNFDVAASLIIALHLGAKAYVSGYEDVLDIPIDDVVRVNCVVGFDNGYLVKALEILKRIGLLNSSS